MKIANDKKGISLIVLVITIIVMLILAAAIILSLQSSGIIGRANEAKSKTDVANAKQVVAMANAEWQLDEVNLRNKYSVETFKEYASKKLEEAGYKMEEGEGSYEVDDRTVYEFPKIPRGFVVSKATGENKVSEGLVIYEAEVEINDDNVINARETYNQYVWIPVEGNFERIDWENSGFVLNDTEETMKIEEYNQMKASVKKYGGFYIARYESGTTTQRNENTSNKTTEVVVQKNKYVYNCVGWAPRKSSTTGDVIDYDDYNQGKGAVELSREMYKNSDSVVSTLCYGVQWDATLKFISKKHPEYPINSTNKGNYEGEIIETGSNDNYKVNNIYDMAGNLYEWTMECFNIGGCVQRGGNFVGNGKSYPASIRCDGDPAEAIDAYGFRVALYLK